MKKSMHVFALLFVGLLGFTLWSCSDNDDRDEIISQKNLPSAAQSFISTYYPDVQILKAVQEKEHGKIEYDVTLGNGHEITFDSQGEWIDVDAPFGDVVPEGIVPQQIAAYVAENYPLVGVNEISRIVTGYEVELTNGYDLYFDTDYGYVGMKK